MGGGRFWGGEEGLGNYFLRCFHGLGVVCAQVQKVSLDSDFGFVNLHGNVGRLGGYVLCTVLY